MLDLNTLDGSTWDVVISGTGLPQAFLALALSRSGKKILHIDKNNYYGGSEAAFSLQEAEEWVKKVNEGIISPPPSPHPLLCLLCEFRALTCFLSKSVPNSMPFESASISRPAVLDGEDDELSFSRAYTLSLSPQLLFSQSRFLPSLVSSRVYRQLEFQAVGSWWIYQYSTGSEANSQPARLQRVPSSREDVFTDETMSMKSKRSLMKLLRQLMQPGHDQENEAESEVDQNMQFQNLLETKYRIPSDLFDPLLSLSLSLKSMDTTDSIDAIPNIKRHLSSIGVFGPGFGAVLAKWGGGAEFSQAACRACAVGGGIYALGREIKKVDEIIEGSESEKLHVYLTDNESVKSRYVVGSGWDLPEQIQRERVHPYSHLTRAIMIVNSSLEILFPQTSENGPVPAGAVVTIPSRNSGPPTYLLVHSSDTGECPANQCEYYHSTSNRTHLTIFP
ncbi:Rab geranylgeranyl transferase escort protein, putative [Trichophyton benhamiae CBS 112371]|uniref:Rab geranylgeranyl transferase escort protein, putative n=1 Tax=Arthroderma benhamiae (strain ATCC MYA-4681 / CBS 112371) TaxID=663331 RepID=D4B0M9_ARTBC|nr:Rab geranylgeranyl transferase escort protein, putative [Trichophyton benhamiae CBS 112371]EFE31136.1 Rab geranylgeranyl transferase escort protein, putative [Trichophyton benhamiae CBS 112371]